MPLPSERNTLETLVPRGEKGGFDNDLGGILPIGKSVLWSPWNLPGWGSSYDDCGKVWRDKGCLNVNGHGVERADGVSYAGKIYVKRVKNSCKRAECPVCYEKWIAREVNRALRRLEAYSKWDKPIHVIASPGQADVDVMDYAKLRKKANQILRSVGVLGGVMIIHPFRKMQPEAERGSYTFLGGTSWYLSPHFHVVCYGWVSQVGQQYERSGWIVKNLGLRESVGATLYYQLSHAGVYIGKHKKATITWFGRLSYSKLKVVEPEKKGVCPICHRQLVRLEWFGGLDRPPPIPEQEGEWFIEPEGWIEQVNQFVVDAYHGGV